MTFTKVTNVAHFVLFNLTLESMEIGDLQNPMGIGRIRRMDGVVTMPYKTPAGFISLLVVG